ncbi:hypothetical protein KLF32_06105 [Clostridium perfringens]|uniref:hypothetical protein n=2 Tax=Clostridium perfringens TaxID=1502 RepID=UPI001A1BC81A|nr:hypothetical protein [Clostridium perfringens]ELC8344108.1 hypothetical protein [Clostridium perfringens]MDK0890708.1 hypothetical protein [Clostridium perfringens]MDM0714360.1 hypothetical protein [Clostridium perfringens]UBK69877.1 hypothetical protein KLF38_05765 [Clostridium perfringens]UBK72526.1 hypothetical protein KLF32_06105 [Clostridium perfringens]
MDNSITNLIFQLEEFCRLADPSWENELRKINKIYERYGDNISYMETEDNLIFIDKTGEIVRCLYEG